MNKRPTKRNPIARRDLLGFGLIGAALGILSYRLVVPARRRPAGDVLSVREAFEQSTAGEILLIDIRRPEEWAQTGIPAPAIPIDMRRPDFTDALKQAANGADAIPVALICAKGVRSARLAKALRDAGIGPVLDVPEGVSGSAAGPGWIASALPLKTYEAGS